MNRREILGVAGLTLTSATAGCLSMAFDEIRPTTLVRGYRRPVAGERIFSPDVTDVDGRSYVELIPTAQAAICHIRPLATDLARAMWTHIDDVDFDEEFAVVFEIELPPEEAIAVNLARPGGITREGLRGLQLTLLGEKLTTPLDQKYAAAERVVLAALFIFDAPRFFAPTWVTVKLDYQYNDRTHTVSSKGNPDHHLPSCR